MPEFLCNNCL